MVAPAIDVVCEACLDIVAVVAPAIAVIRVMTAAMTVNRPIKPLRVAFGFLIWLRKKFLTP